MERILFMPNFDLLSATGAAVHTRKVIAGFENRPGWAVSVIRFNPTSNTRLLQKMAVWRRGLQRASVLNEYLRTSKVDVCYLRYDYSDYPLYQSLRRSGVPYVLELNSDVRGELRAKRNVLGSIWNEAVEPSIVRNCSGLLSVAEDALKSLQQRYVLSMPNGLTFNGADIGLLAPRDEATRIRKRRELNLPPGAFLWCFVGKLAVWHGLDFVLKVLAEEPGFENDHLLFVGTGMEQYGEVVQQSGMNQRTHRIGWVDEPELADWLSAADMGLGTLALFRKSMTHAQSLKKGTYLACGLPVLTGMHIDTRVPPEAPLCRVDIRDYAPAVEVFRQARQLVVTDRLRLRELARKTAVQAFSWDSIVDHTEVFVRECIGFARGQSSR